MDKTVEQEVKRRRSKSEETKEKRKIKVKTVRKIEWQNVLDKKKIVAIVIGILIVLGIIVVNNYTTFGLVLNRNIDSKDAVRVELQTTNNKVISFGDEVLVYNKGTITSYNNYGKNTGTITLHDTLEAEISTSGKYIQVINKDKGLVYVYKNQYEVARIKVEGKIYGGNINSQGMSVIEYSSNGNKTSLGIYDNSGEMKYNVKLNNNIVGKYVLSDNSKYLAFVDVNVSGISVCTNINFVDLSNVGQQDSDIQKVYTTDNALAYDLYWNGRNIIARFDESYMIYNVSSNKMQNVQISDKQIVDIDNYDNRYAYTGLDEAGNYMMAIRKMTSESLKTVKIEDTPKYFQYENGIAYVCYGKKIEAYNNFGTKLKTYNSDMVIVNPVVFNNGRSIAMTISNQLIMFTI